MNPSLFPLLGKGELITPTRSLARSIRQRHAQWLADSGARAWEPPQVFSWEGWCRREWQALALGQRAGLALLHPLQQRHVWQGIIEVVSGGQLLSSVATTAAALQSYRTLRAWRLHPKRELAWRAVEGNQDQAAFCVWLARYESWLEQHQRIDAEGLPDWLAEGLGVAAVSRTGRIIHYYGFTRLTPQQEHLFECLKATGVQVQALSPPVQTAALARCRYPSLRQELRAAVRWARSLLEREPESRIAILSADLRKLRPLLKRELALILEPECAFWQDSHSPFSLSVGLPLADYAMLRSALHALQLGTGGLAPDQVSSLLLSPWLPGADSEQQARALLDARLRRWQRPLVRLSSLLHACTPEVSSGGEHRYACPELRQSLSAMQRLCDQQPARQGMAQWMEGFSRCLGALGWPGSRGLDTVGQQLLEHWGQALEDCAGLGDLAGEVSAGMALGQLSQLLREQAFQPETPDAPIQILTPEAAVGMGFDHIWWLGMHDQAWPPAARPDPFLPLAAQKTVQLPRATARLQFQHASRITEALQDSCRTLVFSHAEQQEERSLRPSPLSAQARDLQEWCMAARASPPSAVESMQAGANTEQAGLRCLVEAGADSDQDYRHMIRRTAWHERRIPERWQDVAQAPVPLEGTQVSGGSTLFADQALCPFRAFARHRLGARGWEAPDLVLVDARLRGIIAHEAMERIWQQLLNRQGLLAERDDGRLDDVVQDTVGALLEQYAERQPELFQGVFLHCERQRIEQLVLEFLQQECQRQEDFAVESLEYRVEAEFAGLRIHLQTDRVDCLSGGGRVLLDYKTGGVSTRRWQGERPEEPQLPLYALTMEEDPVAIAYACLRRGERGFVGWSRAPVQLPGDSRKMQMLDEQIFQQRLAEWRKILQDLAEDFRAGHAEVNPKRAEVCQRCDLHALCRIHDRQEGIDAR